MINVQKCTVTAKRKKIQHMQVINLHKNIFCKRKDKSQTQ